MKSRFWALFMIPALWLATHPESNVRGESSFSEIFLISDKKNVAIENFPKEEQQVYHELGPLYQKIYLYAFNDEERHRVVVYTKRGLTPFEAINTILRAEERQYQNKKGEKNNKPIAPSSRGSVKSSASTIF